MIEENRSLFDADARDKQYLFDFGDFALTNDQLYDESLTLTESICKEDTLRFGCCEASILQFRVVNTVQSMKGCRCVLSVTVEGANASAVIGTYTVESDKPTADRYYRDVTAYDDMYDIINVNVAEWYNSLTFPMTLKAFRDSFFRYWGIEQEVAELVNDGMVVTETIKPSELSGQTVITAICELNGCFGRIGRDGKIHYVFLRPHEGTLYPAVDLYPADALYPAENEKNTIPKARYISCKYEDYKTALIDKVQIRQEENDIGAIVGEGSNCYIVQDNFLVYGMEPEPLAEVARNLLSVIDDISYRPATVEAKGNPCFEPGDAVRLYTNTAIIDTYILQRTLKGIQALKDTYEADGEEYQAEKVNSVNQSIIQLRGKTNTLTRTVEETRLEIKDIEAGLSSRITQTAASITAEVTRATEAEGKLSSKITQTADSITAEVTRATEAEGTLNSKITLTADSIASEVSRATEAEGKLSSKITQTADSITSEVQRASSAEGTLSSRITQNAESIQLKVAKGDVSSQLSVESGKVSIKSNRFELDATNCSISADGTLKARNCELTGKITAQSGTIGGMTVDGNCIRFGKTSVNDSQSGVYIGTDGIAVGYGYSGPAFKVASSGSISVGILGDFTLSSGQLNLNSLQSYIKHMGTAAIQFTSSTTKIVSLNPVIGNSNSSVGFFGGYGATKKSVSTLSSSASLTTCISKVNELINALKAYNLIG